MTMPNYETREVTHGNSYGAFAPIETNSDGTLNTDIVPTIFTGLRGVSFETTQDSEAFYADNVEHIRLLGIKTIEGNITAYQIPQSFMVNHLGYSIAPNGSLIDTGIQKNFIWQFIETVTQNDGTEVRQLTVYYNVKAATPTAEANTDEDTITPKEFEIPCTVSPNHLVKDSNNKSVTYMILRETTANSGLIDLAYNQIILPNTPVPTPPNKP